MKEKHVLRTAGIIFFLFGTIHTIRFFLGADIVVNGHEVPEIWSVFAALIGFGLSVWMFRSAR